MLIVIVRSSFATMGPYHVIIDYKMKSVFLPVLFTYFLLHQMGCQEGLLPMFVRARHLFSVGRGRYRWRSGWRHVELVDSNHLCDLDTS